MEARYAFRKSQLLDACQMAPEIFEQVIPRLYTFMKPFVRLFDVSTIIRSSRQFFLQSCSMLNLL